MMVVMAGCFMTTVALTTSAVAIAGQTADPVQQLAGRFSEHFENSDVDGDNFWSDNIVEVVPVSTHAAYFRIHLEFYNGHECGIWGIAQTGGSGLRYQHAEQVYDFKAKGMKNTQCVLQISKQGDHLLLQELDPDSACKINYCGMRGSFDGITLPWNSHRPITYLQKLKASRQYQDTLKQWHDQTGGGPAAPDPEH